MNDYVEAQLERMMSGIGLVVEGYSKGNCTFDQLNDVAKQQIEIFEQHVATIEKRNKILQNSTPRGYTRAYV